MPSTLTLPTARVNRRPQSQSGNLLSQRAGKIASFIISRGNERRRDPEWSYYVGKTRWEKRYTHICGLAAAKYPFDGPMPEWVNAGLD